LDTLAKHIEQHLKEREFCVVFEDELERCWPWKKLKQVERERQFQAFAESHGWSASILDSDSGPRAIFREVKWKDAFCSSSQGVGVSIPDVRSDLLYR
jgi:hypothetical protein